uniref:BZIP domain-containing protein n=1 Tax=Rhabditophanes sp. KR3021 TaxID=114890 RepID=A0AC35TSB5_9BILA
MGFNIFKRGSKKTEKENNNPSGRSSKDNRSSTKNSNDEFNHTTHSRMNTDGGVYLGDDSDVMRPGYAYSVPTAPKKHFGPKSLPGNAFASKNQRESVRKPAFADDYCYESNRHHTKREFQREPNFYANQSMQPNNNMNNSMYGQRHIALSSRDQNRTSEYGSGEQSPSTPKHFKSDRRENKRHDRMIMEEDEDDDVTTDFTDNDDSDFNRSVSHRHSSNMSRVHYNKAPSYIHEDDIRQKLRELSDKCKHYKRKYREHKEKSSRLEDQVTICMTKYQTCKSQLHDTKNMYSQAHNKCKSLEGQLRMVEAELAKQRQINIYQNSTAGYNGGNSVLNPGSREKMSTLNGSEININSDTNSISGFSNFNIHNQGGTQHSNVRFSLNQAQPSQYFMNTIVDDDADEQKQFRSQREDDYYIEGTRDQSFLAKSVNSVIGCSKISPTINFDDHVSLQSTDGTLVGEGCEVAQQQAGPGQVGGNGQGIDRESNFKRHAVCLNPSPLRKSLSNDDVSRFPKYLVEQEHMASSPVSRRKEYRGTRRGLDPELSRNMPKHSMIEETSSSENEDTVRIVDKQLKKKGDRVRYDPPRRTVNDSTYRRYGKAENKATSELDFLNDMSTEHSSFSSSPNSSRRYLY